MAKMNVKKVSDPVFTHGGAVTAKQGDVENLKRAVLSCMLWEDQHYEDGMSIAERIAALVPKVKPETVQELAIKARADMKLRHVPLLLAREMVRHDSHKKLVADTLFEIVQRPDELSEFMAIYWAGGKSPIAAQVKKGLARAFTKFSEYSLAKYRGEGKQVSLKDVMFLTHAKPSDVSRDMAKWDKDARRLYNPDQGFCREFTKGELLFGKLVNDALATPDTWEVALSAGGSKKETWERLLKEKKLGVLAFLRNLRNMYEAGISRDLVAEYAATVNVDRALPFRFITAAKYAPQWERQIEEMMFRCVDSVEKLPGKTVLIVDISGSMGSCISGRSEVTRLQTAGALAILAREMCEDIHIYATAGSDMKRVHKTKMIPARRGFALSDACVGREVYNELGGGGIFLNQVMDYVYDREQEADRVIILTDEQDCDVKANPKDANAFGKSNYIINVASYKNGVAYSKFHHINGWSESVLDYIREYEKLN